MPDARVLSSRTPVTRRRLAADLRELGLREGATAMVHNSMRSLGWVVGGSQAVVEALLDCLGPAGTLCVPSRTIAWSARGRRSTRARA